MNNIFKALDDPTRRQIVDLLKNGDMTAGEIANEFSISKPSITYHLDLLRQGGLITSQKKGQFVLYTLDTAVIDETVKWFFELIKAKMKSEKNGLEESSE